MLVMLLVWCYAISLLYVFGHFTFSVCNKKLKENLPESTFILLTGLIALSTFCHFWSLFYKVGIATHLCILFFTILYIYFQRKILATEVKNHLLNIYKSHPITKLLFVIFMAIGLFYSVVPSEYGDDGLYYIQSMKYIEEYGVVPGAALTIDSIAFNSNWHMVSAFFSFSFFKSDLYIDINGLFYLILMTYSLIGLNRIFTGEKIQKSTFIRSAMMLPTFTYAVMLVPTSADPIIIMGTWILLNTTYEKMETKNLYQYDLISLFLFIFSIYLFTVKISFLIILLLPIYIAFRMILNKETFSPIIITCILILIPFFIRNIIVSGYLLFAFPSLDFFNVEWKLPEYMLDGMMRSIKASARVRFSSTIDVEKMSISEWFPLWWNQKITFYKALVVCIGIYIVYLAISSFICITKKGIKFCLANYEKGILLHSITLISILFWFFNAPDFRFSFGFLFIPAYMLFAYLSLATYKKIKKIFFIYFGLLFIYLHILLYQNFTGLSAPFDPIKKYAIKPAKFPNVECVRTKAYNFYYYLPITDHIADPPGFWNGPIPCFDKNHLNSNYHILMTRTNNIKDGFKIQPLQNQ